MNKCFLLINFLAELHFFTAEWHFLQLNCVFFVAELHLYVQRRCCITPFQHTFAQQESRIAWNTLLPNYIITTTYQSDFSHYIYHQYHCIYIYKENSYQAVRRLEPGSNSVNIHKYIAFIYECIHTYGHFYIIKWICMCKPPYSCIPPCIVDFWQALQALAHFPLSRHS